MVAKSRAVVRPDTPSLVKLINKKFVRNRLVLPPTGDSFVRASSLPSLCSREEVLAGRLKIERVDAVDVDLSLTFAQGSGMHWVFQNEVFPALGNVLVGQWMCKVCGVVTGGLGTKEGNIPMPKKCSSCEELGNIQILAEDESRFEYLEQAFVNQEHRFTGHNDGFLRLPEFPHLGDGVFELKSISQFRAKKIKDVPDVGHAVQAQSYMWLTNTKWCLILYWDKGTYRDCLTEHYVERDEDCIEQIKAELDSIWNGIKTGELPQRLCTSPDCNRAEECGLVEPCFEHEDFAPEVVIEEEKP
jgi:hypothetical protein